MLIKQADICQCPACIVPYLKADATIDLLNPTVLNCKWLHRSKTNPHPSLSRIGANTWADDPIIVDGAPCTIQIVGRRLQDEELLAAAGTISEVLSR